MDKLGIYFNKVSKKIIHPSSGSSSSEIAFQGHAFIKWDAHVQTHFTIPELHLLHRRFGHPSASKPSNFLRLPDLGNPSGDKSTTFETIERHSASFQRYAQAPRRFKFNLKDNFDFNHNFYADVFYIHKRSIVHVVDEATYYQATTSLLSMNAVHMWNTLRRCWIYVYLDPLYIITHDAGKKILRKDFQSQASLLHIQTK